jgi:hypothetical protein
MVSRIGQSDPRHVAIDGFVIAGMHPVGLVPDSDICGLS